MNVHKSQALKENRPQLVCVHIQRIPANAKVILNCLFKCDLLLKFASRASAFFVEIYKVLEVK